MNTKKSVHIPLMSGHSLYKHVCIVKTREEGKGDHDQMGTSGCILYITLPRFIHCHNFMFCLEPVRPLSPFSLLLLSFVFSLSLSLFLPLRLM